MVMSRPRSRNTSDLQPFEPWLFRPAISSSLEIAERGLFPERPRERAVDVARHPGTTDVASSRCAGIVTQIHEQYAC